MNRITQCLNALKAQGKKALATYIVSGDPAPDVTLDAMLALVESGADIIELGVPFSDPMAEGPVIQKGHERALVHGVSLTSTLALVKMFRELNQHTPIILMGYANPVERMGYQRFVQLASESGVDGLLTVDLPPEEGGDLHAEIKRHNLESIYLLAPTSSPRRINSVSEVAGGFIYYVSLKGVTGAGNLDVDSVAVKVEEIHRASALPVLVGFGIKDGASAEAIGRVSDGVVVGSALVAIMGGGGDKNAIIQGLKERVTTIRAALDNIR